MALIYVYLPSCLFEFKHNNNRIIIQNILWSLRVNLYKCKKSILNHSTGFSCVGFKQASGLVSSGNNGARLHLKHIAATDYWTGMDLG